MKHFLWTAGGVLALSLLFSCGGKHAPKSSVSTDTAQVPLAVEEGPGRDDPRTTSADVDFDGHDYHIDIATSPDDSLPKVKDRFGDDYLDNRISVQIRRDGGSPVKYEFTKADFSKEPDVRRDMILGGIAFGNIDARGIHFGAQFNAPGDEEGGTAFKITLPLSGNGAPRIVRDTDQDTRSDDAAD